MVAHSGGARGEDREIGAARALQPELRAFQACADLVVADGERGSVRLSAWFFKAAIWRWRKSSSWRGSVV
jgi:hypothetical protein